MVARMPLARDPGFELREGTFDPGTPPRDPSGGICMIVVLLYIPRSFEPYGNDSTPVPENARLGSPQPGAVRGIGLEAWRVTLRSRESACAGTKKGDIPR